MKLAVVFASFCVAFAFAEEKREEIVWKRTVVDYLGRKVSTEEKAIVNHGVNSMLMKASDLQLRKTPFYRADSLHDFQAGLLALKPVGSKRCFIGKVKKSFDETLEDLRQRAEGTRPPNGRRTFQVSSLERVLEGSGSSLLDSFCKGSSMYQLEERVRFDPARLNDNPFGWIRFPPLLCFYGPIDIWYPEKPIFGERDLPSYLAEWEGPYAPFP